MALLCFSKYVVSFLIMLTTITGELITFELHKSRLNEVIFPGQFVVLECATTIDINLVVNISILQVGSAVVKSGKGLSNVTHIISEASANDSGNYTCIVTYDVITGDPKQLVSNTLFLNVREERPQCFHNGSDSSSYQVGDVLSITCYCFINDPCKWTQVIEGSTKASLVASNKTIYKSKVITRAFVGPLSAMDNTVKFICFYGSLITQRCEIGPLIHRSTDNGFFLPTNTNYSLATTPSSNGTSSLWSKQSTVGIPKNEFQNYIPWLIFGVALFATASFLASLTCTCYLLKKKQGYDLKETEEIATSENGFNGVYKSESQHDEVWSSNFEHTSRPEIPVQNFIMLFSMKGDYAEVNRTRTLPLPLSKASGVSYLERPAEEEVLYAKIDRKKQTKYRNRFDNASNNVRTVRTISQSKGLETSQIDKDSELLESDQEVDSQQMNDHEDVSNFPAQPEKEDLYAKVNKGRQQLQSRNHRTSDVWNEPHVILVDDSDYAEVY